MLIADPGRDTFWELTEKVKGNLHEIVVKENQEQFVDMSMKYCHKIKCNKVLKSVAI